ncbi:hypothetical protein C8Q78DRAFT_341093 [Trametes maxima]|nr:hypothetical protein C8Q78DRAFT_341093 [Trametes maxima]
MWRLAPLIGVVVVGRRWARRDTRMLPQAPCDSDYVRTTVDSLSLCSSSTQSSDCTHQDARRHQIPVSDMAAPRAHRGTVTVADRRLWPVCLLSPR